MDPRERFNDQLESLKTLVEGRLRGVWTSMPGRIVDVDYTRCIVSVEITTQLRQQDQWGNWNWVSIPVIPHVPVVFPRGGGYTLRFPVVNGDECLLVFASRNIDNWWAQGGKQPAFDTRMHHLSDCFAYIGPVSLPNAGNIGWSSTVARWGADDGSAYIEIDKAAGTLKLSAKTAVLIDAPNTNATGEVTGRSGGASVTLTKHQHDQPSDGHGDAEATTNPPKAGT